jgi:hypothetical protein
VVGIVNSHGSRSPDERVRESTAELIESCLRLVAYLEGVAATGHGQKDTVRNMADDVKRKAALATEACKRSQVLS